MLPQRLPRGGLRTSVTVMLILRTLPIEYSSNRRLLLKTRGTLVGGGGWGIPKYLYNKVVSRNVIVNRVFEQGTRKRFIYKKLLLRRLE